MNLSCYLLFDGNCLDAMNFYKTVFDGDLLFTRVGDSPMRDMFPVQLHNRILHAKLTAGVISLSASDWLHPTEVPVYGNTVCLYVNGGSNDETRRLFSRLSASAKVTDELKRQPFGLYGALNDNFGIRWMFQSDLELP